MMLIEYDWLMYGEERSFTEGLSKQEMRLLVIVSGTRTPYGQNSEKRNFTHGAIRFAKDLSGKQTEKIGIPIPVCFFIGEILVRLRSLRL